MTLPFIFWKRECSHPVISSCKTDKKNVVSNYVHMYPAETDSWMMTRAELEKLVGHHNNIQQLFFKCSKIFFIQKNTLSQKIIVNYQGKLE